MPTLICRLFGHDIMKTSRSQRVCLRCGRKETLRNLGHVEAWVEIATAATRAPHAP